MPSLPSPRAACRARPSAVLLGAIVALAACTYSPHPTDGQLRCSNNGECPNGYSCFNADGNGGTQPSCWANGGPGPGGAARDANATDERDPFDKNVSIPDKGATGGVTGTGGHQGSGGAVGTGGRSGNGGATGTSGCADTCPFAGDGVCDEPVDCDLGTDCSDCYANSCTNSCTFAGDGQCDELIDCPLGSDCADCHPSACADTCFFAGDGQCDEPIDCPSGTDCSDCHPSACVDTCPYAGNGICDEPSLCFANTDCTDCHPRVGCSNTCVFPGDFTCNDGGPGASDSTCALGTDCTDCGAR